MDFLVEGILLCAALAFLLIGAIDAIIDEVKDRAAFKRQNSFRYPPLGRVLGQQFKRKGE